MKSPFWRRLFAFGVLLLVLGAAGVFLIPNLRWRAQVIFLLLTGKIPDIDFHHIIAYMLPGSDQSIARLVDTRNPYAVIRNQRVSAVDAKAGALLYRDQCALCHAPDGSGGTGPALYGREFKHGASDWAIFRTIRYGVPGTAMVAHDLPEDKLWRLVTVIRSFKPPAQPGAATSAAELPFRSVSADEIAQTADTSADWLTYSGSYSGARHTALTQISPENIPQLAPRWIFQFPNQSAAVIETTPLVRDGVMFLTAPPAHVMALDAASGELLWSYEHKLPPDAVGGEAGVVNRGLAMLGDAVFMGTGDAHLVALSAKTGAVLWETPVGDYKRGFFITGAPLAFNGLVVTGVGTREFDRGFIAAFDAKTGQERWRFITIPKPGEPGGDTWSDDSWRNGGGPTWLTGSYDPKEDLVYWGVGNPKPDYDDAVRRGDNLYTNAVVALHGADGKLAWYFQFTPADDHDWDAAQIPILADANSPPGPEKRLLWANRNGFYYVLDRVSGKFLTGVPFARETWADGLDAKGRPIPHVEPSPSHKGILIYPGNTGATNWWSPSFDRALNLVFVPTLEQGMVFFPSESGATDDTSAVKSWPSGQGQQLFTSVRALDAATGKLVWEYRRTPRMTDNFMAGLLSTNSGLLFGGDQMNFFALRSRTGELLWSFPAGGRITAAPISFTVNGEQYVAIAAGQNLLAFALPKAAKPGPAQAGSPSQHSLHAH